MILAIKAEHTTVFQSLVEEMVRRENERGDSLDAGKLMLALLSGQRTLLSFYDDEDTPIPIMLLVCHAAVDEQREKSTLWIDNIFVPSGNGLDVKVSQEDRIAMAQRLSIFHQVRFVTDNPAVPRLVASLGGVATKTHEIYSITIPEEAYNG